MRLAKSKLKRKLDQRWRDRSIDKILNQPYMFLALPGKITYKEESNCTLERVPPLELMLPVDYELFLFSPKDAGFNSELQLTLFEPTTKHLVHVQIKWNGIRHRFTSLEYTRFTGYGHKVSKFELQPYFNCISTFSPGIIASMNILLQAEDEKFQKYKDVVCANVFTY